MNNITLITFADGSTVAFATDGSTITATNAGGTATVYTSTAPVVAPTDVEVDIKDSNGNVRTFVPKA
jgi:hypothetical protein